MGGRRTALDDTVKVHTSNYYNPDVKSYDGANKAAFAMARARIAKKQNGPLQHPSGRSYDLEDLHRTSASGWGQSEKAQVDGIGGSTSTSATDDDSGSTIGGASGGSTSGSATADASGASSGGAGDGASSDDKATPPNGDRKAKDPSSAAANNGGEGGHGASSGDGSSSAPGEETLLQALQHKDREEQRAHEAQIAMAANRTLDNYLLGLTGPSDTTST